MNRPDLPKRLASRVRGAQSKVVDAREWIFQTAERIAQDEARIAEFETNPEAFAARHYGHHGPDSYPVVTTISRARAGVERRRGRQDRMRAELKAADARLAAVEAEVLAEVEAMKPSLGRIPWPKSLPTFDKAAERFRIKQDRANADAVAEGKRRQVEIDQDYEREMAENRRLDDEEDAKELAIRRAELAAMTPEQRAAEREAIQRFLYAYRAGKVGFEVFVRSSSKRT